MREAPSREIVKKLLEYGANVQVYDPVAMPEAKRLIAGDLAHLRDASDRVVFCDQLEETLDGADALVIATEWKIFKSPNFDLIKQKLKSPIIFDGRNMYDPKYMKALCIEYYGIGRSSN